MRQRNALIQFDDEFILVAPSCE